LRASCKARVSPLPIFPSTRSIIPLLVPLTAVKEKGGKEKRKRQEKAVILCRVKKVAEIVERLGADAVYIHFFSIPALRGEGKDVSGPRKSPMISVLPPTSRIR